MGIIDKLIAHQQEIRDIAARNGAGDLCVFGSVARGDAQEDSDLDLLVTMEPGRTMLDVGGLVYELMDLLGCRVDVVTRGALRGRLRVNVMRDAKTLEELAA